MTLLDPGPRATLVSDARVCLHTPFLGVVTLRGPRSWRGANPGRSIGLQDRGLHLGCCGPKTRLCILGRCT